jgi:DNA (cytosine-5)-methyltransferase 1
VGEAIRLITPRKRTQPTWLLLENVPFMLQLDRGKAMHYLTDTLSTLGFAWAYRVVDTRSFGLPQRRRRVILLASRTEDPRTVLFADDRGEPAEAPLERVACGFYWTEGLRGLGWAKDAVPTLKGGSSVGIPSPPAIWMPDGALVTPDLRDAERLQGFPADWTLPAQEAGYRAGARWKMVGNAVSVPVFDWVGRWLASPGDPISSTSVEIVPGRKWPDAGWGAPGVEPRSVGVSAWPVRRRRMHLKEFLAYPPKPLSTRAIEGFYKRTQRSSLRFPDGFIESIEEHLRAARIAVA